MIRLFFKDFVTAIFSFLKSIYKTLTCWFTVDAGEYAIQLRNGAIKRAVSAGLYSKIPFIDSIKYISTRTENITFNELSTYSRDQQPTKIKISVTFHVNPDNIKQVYLFFKDINSLVINTIERQVPNQVENIFGQYSTVDVVQKREQITKDINAAIKQSLENYPIIIESVQIENINFSRSYEQTVENRMKAEVEVHTQRQNLEIEKINAEITATKAKAIAASTLAQAQADADAMVLRGDAEAKAMQIKSNALKENAIGNELTSANQKL